jgi:N-sulfoglucosamine sulfohydrolase
MIRLALSHVSLALCLFLPFAAVTAAAPPARPNVLFIIADDASCHFGAYGCSWAKTPNIDALAANGIVFDNAYVPTSKCSPCRAGLLTGRNPWQLEEAANHWPTFPPNSMSFTEAIAAQGVTCAAEGKVWGPGVAKTADGQQRTWGLKKSDFRKFLEAAPSDRPFFYWFGSANPHRAYEPDAGRAAGKKPADIDRVPAYWPDNDVVRRDMLDYATEIEAFDREVGDLMAALRESGRAREHARGHHLRPRHAVSTSEGAYLSSIAHRVPLVVSLARRDRAIQEGGAERLVSLVDLAPTFLELFGVDDEAASGMAPITGTSLVDLLP